MLGVSALKVRKNRYTKFVFYNNLLFLKGVELFQIFLKSSIFHANVNSVLKKSSNHVLGSGSVPYFVSHELFDQLIYAREICR